MTLIFTPSIPKVMLAPSLAGALDELRNYGVFDPLEIAGVRVVTTYDEIIIEAVTLPPGTKWCKVDGHYPEHWIRALVYYFGICQTVADVLGVGVDDTGWRPGKKWL